MVFFVYDSASVCITFISSTKFEFKPHSMGSHHLKACAKGFFYDNLQNQQCQTNMEPAAQIQENNRNHIEKF